MASMYAVYHGPKGIKLIAKRVSEQTKRLASAILGAGHSLKSESFFDTLAIELKGQSSASINNQALLKGINLRVISDSEVGIFFR